MKISRNIHFMLFNLCLVAVLSNASDDNGRKPYIVYMGELPRGRISLADAHHGLLSQAIGDETIARNSRIHSYGRSFNGFVANLLPHEATLLSQKEGIISVFPNTVQKLLTTRSWDFIGMPETVKRNPTVESDIIVGLLDTGVWIESPSFNDKGFGPPPPKWKGKCVKGGNFTGCNNKVIGAQYFDLANEVSREQLTPVDVDGHGTHTSSTVAGLAVKGASLYGLAEGTARGGVPSARIASYKVCWDVGCQDMDLLAAFDAAIADGVDIISVSIGGDPRSFFEDPMAIGSFHALKKGILTSCAGGNSGPDLGSIQNVAPWIMTVAASSIDRQFETSLKLGNGEEISGMSINTFETERRMLPLISGAQAANGTQGGSGNASACDSWTLSKGKVKGKIVYCLGVNGQDSTIKDLGGFGTVMSTGELTDTAFPTVSPATYVSYQDGLKIGTYVNTTKSARAIIYKSRTVNMTAPFIASFSSRGPQYTSTNVLKPDIAAPGLSILAAFSKFTTVTGFSDDDRVVKYNIESGTSMACPHASAVAAYVKSFHPDWSPAAIKSALMTTAKSMKIKPVGAALASGSGQINPRKALNPGLIYDMDTNSYMSFFCKEGYNSSAIAQLTGSKNFSCSSVPRAKGADGLNYPSMHIGLMTPNSTFSAVFYRTVTHVENSKSTYKAEIKSPKGLSVAVVPNVLTFEKPNQKKSFKVMVKGSFLKKTSWYLSGSLVWTSTIKQNVKSPILVYRPLS